MAKRFGLTAFLSSCLWLCALATAPAWAQDAYEPDETPDQAQVINVGDSPQMRTIDNPADQDWVILYSAAAQSLVIQATNVDLGLYLYIDLFDSDGATQLAHIEGGQGNDVTLTLTSYTPHDGYYYVRVASDGSTGNYALGLFDPNLLNPGIVKGTLRNKSTNAVLVRAGICLASNNCTCTSNTGTYTLSSQPGSYTLATTSSNTTCPSNSAANYQAYSTPITLTSNGVINQPDIDLQPFASPPTVNNPSNGSATTTVTLNDTVNPNGSPTTFQFDYRVQGSGSWSSTALNSIGNGTSSTSVPAATISVGCGTTYEYRGHAIYNGTAYYSAATPTFTTSPCVLAKPAVCNVTSGSITTGSATLSGFVNPETSGTATATAKFEYSTAKQYATSTTYANSTTQSQVGPGTACSQSFVRAISGLTCGTTYHYALIATNADGSPVPTDNTFTTAACPTVPKFQSTDPVLTPKGGSEVKFSATVTPNVLLSDCPGNACPVPVSFLYGSTSPPSESVLAAAQLNGIGAQTVTTYATDIVCGRTYYFKAQATSSAGAGYSYAGNFVTDCDLIFGDGFD